MGCICFIRSSRKNIDPLSTKLKIELLLTQLLWPCTDFTRGRGKSAAIITQQTDQIVSATSRGFSAFTQILQDMQSVVWFTQLFIFLFYLYISTWQKNRWLYLSDCLYLASCKTPSGSFLFHKVLDYFYFIVLQLSFMSRVFSYKLIYVGT